MMIKIAFALGAIALQYALMQSHKSGQLHWLCVAGVSIILFVPGLFIISLADTRSKNRLLPWFCGILVACCVFPPAIYVAGEWVLTPNGVINSFTQGKVFYVISMIVIAGGWLFSLALAILYRRAAAQPKLPMD